MCDYVRNKLFSLQDLKYKEFNSKLIPNISKNKIIGVRTPELKKIAKELYGTECANDFLNELPHEYYEENNLQSFLICRIKDFDLCIEEINRFLPYVDNWATCDGLRPICFKSNHIQLLPHIERWITSDKEYTIRFGIEMLMLHFLDDSFSDDYLYKIASIKSDKYYVNMMIAWYFATALSKRFAETLPILVNKSLDKWVHNKTIQKALESYAISDKNKIILKQLKM